jgi:hypothetical protein
MVAIPEMAKRMRCQWVENYICRYIWNFINSL